MQSNFLSYGKNINIPIYYSGLFLNVVSYTDSYLDISTESINNFLDVNTLYLYQDITLICDQNSVFSFKLIFKNDSYVRIKSNVNINGIVFKQMFLNRYMIQSGSIKQEIEIINVEPFGQQFSNGIIKMNIRIKTNKPKQAVINKYIVKYQSDLDSDFITTDFLDIKEKDYQGNDIIQFSTAANNYVFYKISAYYSLNGNYFSAYTNTFKLEKSNITYQNDI